jgi:hypothetical protein
VCCTNGVLSDIPLPTCLGSTDQSRTSRIDTRTTWTAAGVRCGAWTPSRTRRVWTPPLSTPQDFRGLGRSARTPTAPCTTTIQCTSRMRRRNGGRGARGNDGGPNRRRTSRTCREPTTPYCLRTGRRNRSTTPGASTSERCTSSTVLATADLRCGRAVDWRRGERTRKRVWRRPPGLSHPRRPLLSRLRTPDCLHHRQF